MSPFCGGSNGEPANKLLSASKRCGRGNEQGGRGRHVPRWPSAKTAQPTGARLGVVAVRKRTAPRPLHVPPRQAAVGARRARQSSLCAALWA